MMSCATVSTTSPEFLSGFSQTSGIAFRTKMRSEVLPDATVTDPKAFEDKVTLAKEIAEVLRKNVVQARRVENPGSDKEKWSAYHRLVSVRPRDLSICRSQNHE